VFGNVGQPQLIWRLGGEGSCDESSVGGQTYDVAEPEILDAATAAPQLSPRRRRAFQRFGIDKFVKLKLAK
jgi:hypothetical protein